jgi:hypothetical protein
MSEPKKRLENWQKFPLEGETVQNLRYMLDLEADEDFPEDMWKVMALHKALGIRFQQDAWSSSRLAQMVIDSGKLREYSSNVLFVPGETVFVTKVQRDGVYWFPGPMERHIVNCHGDIYLVKTTDIEAPQAAVADSELNRLSRVGERMEKNLKASGDFESMAAAPPSIITPA